MLHQCRPGSSDEASDIYKNGQNLSMGLMQFIVGAVWTFPLGGIVYGLMRVAFKKQRPTLWLETIDVCMKVAIILVLPYFLVSIEYGLKVGTGLYVGVTTAVALVFTTLRVLKPPRRKFEVELANEQHRKRVKN